MGELVSELVTLNVHELTLLALSVAWHVTVVPPSPITSGLEALHDVGVRIPEKSVALGTTKVEVTDVFNPLVGFEVMLDGQESMGGEESATITGNVQFDFKPALSKATHVTFLDESTVNL